MPAWIGEVLTIIYRDLMLPALGIVITVIIGKLSSRANRVLESTDDRNRKEAISAVSNITSQAMIQLDAVVGSAVAYTQKLAELYKSDDTPRLTEAEIKELNDKARELAYAMMPTEITQGSLLNLLGGEAALRTMIDTSIEKQLINLRS